MRSHCSDFTPPAESDRVFEEHEADQRGRSDFTPPRSLIDSAPCDAPAAVLTSPPRRSLIQSAHSDSLDIQSSDFTPPAESDTMAGFEK